MSEKSLQNSAGEQSSTTEPSPSSNQLRGQYAQQPAPPNQYQQQPIQYSQPPPSYLHPTEQTTKTKKAFGVFAMLLIGAASVAAGLWLAFSGQNTISYEELVRSKTTSDITENVSLLHPTEMQKVFLGSNSLELRHNGEDGQGLFSEILVEGVFFGSDFAEVKNEIINGLLEPGSQIHQEFMQELDFAADDSFKLNIGDFDTLEVVDESAEHALQAEITYRLPLAGDENTYIPAKGRYVLVFGQEKLFFIRITSLEDIYDANKRVFEEIVQSIEIE